MTAIYTLIDPRNGEVRYVGMTRRSLKKRLQSHLCARGNNYRTHWVRQIQARGDMPIIRFLQEISHGQAAAAEIYWIAFFRREGCPLVNSTDGGDGVVDLSPEIRATMNAGKKGKPLSDLHRARLSASSKGRAPTPQAQAAAKCANLGRPISATHRAAVSAANKGRAAHNKGVRGVPPETRAKMSAAARARCTPAWRLQQAEWMRGRPAHNKGKTPTIETRQRMRIAQRARRARASSSTENP